MCITDFKYPETERSRGDDEGDDMLFLFMEYGYDPSGESTLESKLLYPGPVSLPNGSITVMRSTVWRH